MVVGENQTFGLPRILLQVRLVTHSLKKSSLLAQL
jgi:hypothetical protein